MSKVKKYRKKPVIVEAYVTDVPMAIETLEGTHHASPGDYIITGVKGEQYPCKPDIFRASYEDIDEARVRKKRNSFLFKAGVYVIAILL